MQKELRLFRTKNGKEPFAKWLASVKDTVTKAHIKNRLNRLMLGHNRDIKSVGDGVFELRIHYGAGYRIYIAEQDKSIILLLIGGSKRTQERDIIKAKKFWQEFQENLNEQK
ncbi:MAG: type II toxin-antitoxin system RelE/ParE family toxin [Gammaproteobacteria bacterium]|nr:type II toxin-antitoxin system RelE/ParE family toxin [Gammaproteobacteria bacterium]